ncbi:MAG: glycosyltransferase [Microcella sp.]
MNDRRGQGREYQFRLDAPIVVDITAVSGQSFYTGVQRVVREFVAANMDDLLLVRYDPKSDVFRAANRITALKYRPTKGFVGRLRVRLKNWYWSLSRGYREQGTRRSWIPTPVRSAARWFYDTFLADAYLERELRRTQRPVWQPLDHQRFVLLDIPVGPRHVEALDRLLTSADIASTVYLHDLFPLSHKHLFDKRYHPGVRARHLRYLDVVGAATHLVTNSRFTRSQYERFVDVLEESPDQRIETLYLPWPRFDDPTDDDRAAVLPHVGEASVRVLAVGALDARKNLLVVVRAVRRLLADGVPVSLVIVSSSTDRNDPLLAAELLDLSASERESIRIVTALPNAQLVALYDLATVVAVPSVAEGFGLPVVEALSRGTRVVAARATALVELAESLPVTLADPADAAEWAAALLAAHEAGRVPEVVVPDAFPADWVEFRRRLLS